ncbi:hypothetical protein FRC06_005104 [Ceratobasidium sp. 370]|nr:hypothetical protein FRC06_005104 [Ceratobasidium sp. 370]
MLDIPQLIGRDFSNPLIAPHLVFYPEDSGNRLSESWQAKKWRDEVPLEHLTPMYADGGKAYYVNELARLHNGAYVIPRRWITRNGQLTADCWPVNWQLVPGSEEETGLQVSENIIHVPANSFASNYYDLIEHMDAAAYRFTVASKSFEEKMPNPLRKLAGDSEELVSCFIKPWCDDVSGGRTKQYQPHNNIYIMHANLPGSFLNQEFSVRFASTATHASSTEQFEAIKEQLEANNKNPIRVYNAATGRYVRLRIYVLNIPGDNRAQSEVASHAVGDLGAMLWYSEIMDLELYLADLSIVIDNVLDAFTKLDPGRIIAKLKLHILTHLVEDIRNHGPAVRYSTEIFECYNGVFRMCSILSNHRAPSRDIAQKMIELERFRHIVCGGYWETSDGPACASVEVRRFFESSLKLQSHLGWVTDKKPEPGKITLHSSKQMQSLKWQDTTGGKAGIKRMFFTERNWHVGESVQAANGDECEVGSWIVATHSQATIIGRVQEILVDADSGTHRLVTIDRFDVAENRHSILGMPVLVQTNTDICYTTVLSSYAVDFALNVQHDCLTLRCPNSAIELIRQERRNTTLERQTVEHQGEVVFIINMHALHNARRIREVLPRHLTEPVPLRTEQDRQHFIATSARQWHVRQGVRREETSKKRKAAREAHNIEAQE